MPSPDTRSRSERTFPLLLSALTALTALSIDMSLPALPALQRVFHTTAASVLGTLTLFLLGYALGQLVCGPISDRRGRKPVLMAGIVLFVLAGVGCALSTSLAMLIVLRMVQGFGASVGPVLARAMVRDRYAQQDASAVLSQMTQVMILAPLIAPTIGGALVASVGWRGIFALLGFSGTALYLVCRRSLPETLPPDRRHDDGPLLTYVGQGFRAVLTHRESLRHALTVCFSYGGMFAYVTGSPFVIMGVFGVAERFFGLCFALTAVCLMIGASVNRALLPRVGPDAILRGGVQIVFAAGILLVGFSLLRWGGLAGLLVPMMLYLFGMGLVQPNATAAAMQPHGKTAGASASVIGGLQTLMGAFAGSCIGFFYRHNSLSLSVTVAALALLTRLVAVRKGRSSGGTTLGTIPT